MKVKDKETVAKHLVEELAHRRSLSQAKMLELACKLDSLGEVYRGDIIRSGEPWVISCSRVVALEMLVAGARATVRSSLHVAPHDSARDALVATDLHLKEGLWSQALEYAKASKDAHVIKSVRTIADAAKFRLKK